MIKILFFYLLYLFYLILKHKRLFYLKNRQLNGRSADGFTVIYPALFRKERAAAVSKEFDLFLEIRTGDLETPREAVEAVKLGRAAVYEAFCRSDLVR